jgi:hypothetical protein
VQAQLFTFGESETTGLKSISLITTPISASALLGQSVSVGLTGAYARGVLERSDGTTSEISNLTDTQLSATLALADGVVGLTGVVSLPTGNSTLADNERDLAGRIASDLIPFRISNWGSGGGAGVRASVAQSFGTVGAGFSATYFVAQDFTPLAENEAVYRPGNNLAVRAAIEGDVGRTGKLSLQLTYHSFQSDVADGANLYRSGNRYQAIASYAFPAGRRSSGVVYGGAMHRAGGINLQERPVLPAGPQTLFMAGYGGRLRQGGAVLMPTLDLRALRSDDGIDQGVEGRAGLAAEFGAGGWTFIPVARIHFGSVTWIKDVNSSVLGGDVGLTIRIGG